MDWTVEHGNLDSIQGPLVLGPVRNGVASSFEVSLLAAGVGCNIILKMSGNGTDFRLMAATPSNKENYTKFTANGLDALHDKDKNYSSDGVFTAVYDEFDVLMTITNSSPAKCYCYFNPKQ